MKDTSIYTDPAFRTRLASDSRKTLEPCWAIHSELPSYPKATREVLLLVASMGWDCLPTYLANSIDTGQFEAPKKIFDLHAWEAEDIARLMLFLDSKRMWLVGFHGDMKTEIEIQRDEAEAEKGMQMLEFYQRMPREELQHRFDEAQTSPARELLSAALRMQGEIQ